MTVIPMKIIMYYFCSFCKRNFQKKFLSFFGLAGDENFFQLAFVKLLIFLECGGENGAENDNGPGQVHPNQKDGQGGQGTVESFVSGGHGYGTGEAFTEQPEQNNCDQSTEKGVFDMNFFVGNQHINQKQQKKVDGGRQEIAEHNAFAGHVFRHHLLQGEQVAAEGKNGAEQQRTESDDSPVQCYFGGESPRTGDFENEVQAVFNG